MFGRKKYRTEYIYDPKRPSYEQWKVKAFDYNGDLIAQSHWTYDYTAAKSNVKNKIRQMKAIKNKEEPLTGNGKMWV